MKNYPACKVLRLIISGLTKNVILPEKTGFVLNVITILTGA